jgi:hypothetical protein
MLMRGKPKDAPRRVRSSTWNLSHEFGGPTEATTDRTIGRG